MKIPNPPDTGGTPGINSYTLECEERKRNSLRHIKAVLIVTLWNVKTKQLEAGKQLIGVLIVTLWNVKYSESYATDTTVSINSYTLECEESS